jgi:hypothetical protein
VTPVGVRDGDPDALAGLCDRRGPAVLAYCEVVAGRGEMAVVAAADAFGSFRAGVVAAPDLANLNPEALLISATRHAAARHAGTDMPPEHQRVPVLLAARADRSITLADHDFLEQHLAACWTCRAPVARFEAADRAYLDPPTTALAPEAKLAMVAALTAAAPVLGAEPEPEPAPYVPDPAAVFPNGSGPHEPEGYVEQPTSAYQIGVDDVDLVGAPLEAEAAAAAQPEPRTARGRGMTRRPRSEGKADRPARRSRRASGATVAPVAAPVAAAAVTPTEDPRGAGGTSLPRPQRARSASAKGRRSRPALRPGVVLPVALVILAIVVALIIAGVFGGGEPASSPQSFAPTTSEPADTAPAAPVVDVPGAATATAAAVEKAKARARRLAADKKAGGATTTTPAATTTPPPPPAAAAQPAGTTDAASTTPPPPPPPPATNTNATKKPKIDASQGATGAEQLPQKKDTSSVPDLAPAAEPVAPPN